MNFAEPTDWLTPEQAIARLNCTLNELVRLVTDARLTAHRLPTGALVFSLADLDALRTPVPADEAARLLSNIISKDNTMPIAAENPLASKTLIDANHLFQKFDELIEETKQVLERQPKWLDIQSVKRIYSIDPRRLLDFVSNGFVRKVKMGEALQSKALYSAADIDSVLARMAVGKPPLSALRKSGGHDAA